MTDAIVVVLQRKDTSEGHRAVVIISVQASRVYEESKKLPVAPASADDMNRDIDVELSLY